MKTVWRFRKPQSTFGNLTESTDQFGVFQFNDRTMHSGGTYIKVEKDGYFHGSRKFYPVANATSRVTIEPYADG